MTDPETGEISAAGAVVWRTGQLIETALVHRPRYGDWSFPKGKRMPGEHILLTAVREVAEETGVRVALGRRLPSTHYLAEGGRKQVDYWAARPVSAGAFAANAEVDALAWLPLPAARDQLSYAHDVTVLDSFDAGPPGSAPVILLRHASAVGKRAWSEAGHADDLRRPLSPAGRAEAAALSQILGCFEPARVISSVAERCLATVAPYAALTGTPVEPEPAFTLDAAGQSGAADWAPTRLARERITGLVTGGQPVIVCAHRQNLAWLLDCACELLGAPVPDGPPLRRGAFWVLQVSDGKLASAEQHQASAVPAEGRQP